MGVPDYIRKIILSAALAAGAGEAIAEPPAPPAAGAPGPALRHPKGSLGRLVLDQFTQEGADILIAGDGHHYEAGMQAAMGETEAAFLSPELSGKKLLVLELEEKYQDTINRYLDSGDEKKDLAFLMKQPEEEGLIVLYDTRDRFLSELRRAYEARKGGQEVDILAVDGDRKEIDAQDARHAKEYEAAILAGDDLTALARRHKEEFHELRMKTTNVDWTKKTHERMAEGGYDYALCVVGDAHVFNLKAGRPDFDELLARDETRGKDYKVRYLSFTVNPEKMPGIFRGQTPVSSEGTEAHDKADYWVNIPAWMDVKVFETKVLPLPEDEREKVFQRLRPLITLADTAATRATSELDFTPDRTQHDKDFAYALRRMRNHLKQWDLPAAKEAMQEVEVALTNHAAGKDVLHLHPNRMKEAGAALSEIKEALPGLIRTIEKFAAPERGHP